ncbi:MAG: polysaccharide deacetylase family protein [Shimia sp.]
MKRLIPLLAGILIILCGLYGARAASKSTTWQSAGEIVARVETNERVVALTLDDGPSGRNTLEVSDNLGDAQATFYLVGKDMMANPGEVAEIIVAGHEVGNHSYTHERMILRPAEEMISEIRATDAGLRGAGAEGPFTFRPPYGSKGIAVPRYLAEEGRVTVM